jgi:HAD superfamily hydrolase (TIGR01509 family)
LLESPESPESLCSLIEDRYKMYKIWAKSSQSAVSENELWTRWLLPDHPAKKIAPLAGKLSHLWNTQGGRRVIRPDVKSTVIELNQRGYILGIIANSAFETEIPNWLEEHGIRQYFKVLALSAVLGIRKPDPRIFQEAARQGEVQPSDCAYVADNPVRDITGAKSAGYRMVVILLEAETLKKDPPIIKELPSRMIFRFGELLDIFPAR